MDSFFNWPVKRNASHLSDEIVSCFEKITGMVCIAKDQVHEPNLCYIDSEAVRDEYRTTFSRSDILNYIYAMQHSPSYTMNEMVLPAFVSAIPYPKNNINFWKLARLGNELKQANAKDSTLAKKLLKAIAGVD